MSSQRVHSFFVFFNLFFLLFSLPLFRLELVVDPWIDGLWLALKEVFLLQKEKEGMSNDVSADSHVGHEMNLSSKIQNLNLEDGVRSSDGPSHKLVDINVVASATDTEPSLVHSVPPISQSALNIPALPPEYIEVQFQDTHGEVRTSL